MSTYKEDEVTTTWDPNLNREVNIGREDGQLVALCTIDKLWHTYDDFHKSRQNKDGIPSGYCRECDATYRRRRTEAKKQEETVSEVLANVTETLKDIVVRLDRIEAYLEVQHGVNLTKHGHEIET